MRWESGKSIKYYFNQNFSKTHKNLNHPHWTLKSYNIFWICKNSSSNVERGVIVEKATNFAPILYYLSLSSHVLEVRTLIKLEIERRTITRSDKTAMERSKVQLPPSIKRNWAASTLCIAVALNHAARRAASWRGRFGPIWQLITLLLFFK